MPINAENLLDYGFSNLVDSSLLAALAQLVEQRTENPCVPGSIPGGGTPKAPEKGAFVVYDGFIIQLTETAVYAIHRYCTHYERARIYQITTSQSLLSPVLTAARDSTHFMCRTQSLAEKFRIHNWIHDDKAFRTFHLQLLHTMRKAYLSRPFAQEETTSMRQETRAATTTISGRAIPSGAPSLLLSHLIHLGTPSGTTTNSE